MKVFWSGDVLQTHSLSLLARPLLSSLSLNYDVYIEQWTQTTKPIVDEYSEVINSLVDKPHPAPTEEDVVLLCKYPLPIFPPDHKARIIPLIPWEFNVAPTQWVDYINNYCDQVLTISPDSADVIRDAVSVPVTNLPIPIHPIFFRDYERIPGPPTILYDAGASWRKGPDIFLNLMRRFSGMTELKFIWKDSPIYRNFCFEDVKDCNVNCDYIYKDISYEKLHDLYRSADVVVYPTRAEGFGYCPAQAMAMGIPVVAPIHTGMAQYLRPEYCYPVDWTPQQVPSNYLLSPEYGLDVDPLISICEPSADHLYYMTLRALFGGPKRDLNWSRSYMGRYTVEHVTQCYLEFLQDVEKENAQ